MNELDIARKIFQEIQSEFPEITMHIDEEDSNVEILMDIPEQNDIRQPITLFLSNIDELHFQVGNFWCEWFPCGKDNNADDYKKAVVDYIKGINRIVEHYKGSKCYKAELQAPLNGSWVTLATWATCYFSFFSRKSEKILFNNTVNSAHAQ